MIRAILGPGFYQIYFQQRGVADAELAWNVRRTFRRLLYSASGDGALSSPQAVIPEGQGFLDIMTEPEELPGWLDEADVDVFTGEFESAGFTGGLNWYRSIDRNWELTATWRGAPVRPPALFVTGDRDLVWNFPRAREQVGRMSGTVPNLRDVVMLPGCGHWTQQERPEEVNRALLAFLAGL